MDIKEMGQLAKEASLTLAALDSDTKNRAILAMADAIDANRQSLIQANETDLALASTLAAPLKKRLKFDEEKINEVLSGLKSLEKLPDPVGATLQGTLLDDGLELYKVACPIGVIGVIFESRPDALVQIASLCLKSGNGVMMKGGSEALNSNRALAGVIKEASRKAGVPDGWLQLLETRADVGEMLQLNDCIDLIVPRGSNAFVKYIMDHTNIPVMGHAEGLCHLYVDGEADVDMAVRLCIDAKTQNVAVCNAIETLLVHRDIAGQFLPRASQELRSRNVRLLGCPKSRAIVPWLGEASEEDWRSEYLDYVLSIKVVDTFDEAVKHINVYGSGHTDVIVTTNPAVAATFIRLVKSADVFWNCSSRFCDGYRFGFGAEMGISTGKLHARGPVGLEGLCTYKWVLNGNGQIVADYISGKSHYKHQKIK